MNKAVKITGITLLSILAVVVVVACIAIWLVFTPNRLSSIARNQADKVISCEYELGEIDLTFFKTFPQFGVHLTHILLKNPVEGAQSDTLLYLGEMVAKVNAKALWKNNEIIIDELWARRLDANVFYGNNGINNLDILSIESSEEEETTESSGEIPFGVIDMSKAGFYEINLSYVDLPSGMNAAIQAFNAEVGANYKDGRAKGKVQFGTDEITAFMKLDTASVLQAKIKDLDTDVALEYQDNNADVKLNLKTPDVWVNLDGEDYLKSNSLKLTAPVVADLDKKSFDLNNVLLNLEKIALQLDGNVVMEENDDIVTDVDFNIGKMKISELLALVPPSFTSMLEGMEVEGLIGLGGNAKGVYNDTSMPLVTANLQVEETDFAYSELPIKFHDIAGNVDALLDMNDDKASYAAINSLQIYTGESSISANGRVNELMGDNMKLAFNVGLDLLLAEFKDFLPEGISATGSVKGPVKARLSMAQLERMDVEAMNISGSLDVSNLIADVDTTINVNSDGLKLDFTIPNDKPEVSLVNARLYDCAGLDVKMTGDINASLTGIDLYAQLSNILADTTNMAVDINLDVAGVDASMEDISGVLKQLKGNASVTMDMIDTTALPKVAGTFSMQSLVGVMDTVSINIDEPRLGITLEGTPEDKGQILATVNYESSSLNAVAGDYTLNTEALQMNVAVRQDSLAENILLQWNPEFNMRLSEGHAFVASLNENVHIPIVLLDFNNNRVLINDGRFNIGPSDFRITGEIDNLSDYLSDKGLLQGELDFTSEVTDVNYFMNLVSGSGVDEEALEVEYEEELALQEPATAAELEEANPFIVPMGVDLVLNTNIKTALVGEQTASNLGGKLYVKDGVLVLEEMGFVSKATKLQLTAIYKSPRKNHLYVGLDYHMLDIEIDELLKMIPDLDTIMPMLKAFHGNGEFHLAAETYLKANYDLKMSTLRGAASIMADDLVVMDSTVFKKIRKLTLMGKKTENKIDSLNAEITVFRDEVDVYPLMVSMGRYQAILGGRHNLDMTYDYHLSLTESPLPFRLGVNVFTKPKGMKIRLAKCKYAADYKPGKQYVVDAKQRELRAIIRDALTANVNRDEE